MLKTFKTIQAQDREKFIAPESVQDVIPVKRVWDDGIFLVGKNKYSKNLQSAGMLIMLDSILNRITRNRKRKRNTYIFIDQIYLMFQNEYSANFLHTLWKRVRKYGAFCTGITQNVEDLLQSHTARTMLSNSELLVMLNQSGNDMDRLAELLNISNTQRSFMENVGPGQGLLKVGSSLVPFVNQFPTNTSLYKLMSTKINE